MLASLVFVVAPAQATFHLEKVSEVMLASSSGDVSVQFVECHGQYTGRVFYTAAPDTGPPLLPNRLGPTVGRLSFALR